MEVEIHLYVSDLKLLFRNQALCCQSDLTVSKLGFFLILGVFFQWTYYASNILCMFPIDSVYILCFQTANYQFSEKNSFQKSDLLGRSFPSVSNK